MEKVSGVYTITCKINGRRYVGSSTHVHSRWSTHKSALNLGKHTIALLQADWNEHGPSAFEFRLIAAIRDKDARLVMEQALIDQYESATYGYNRSPSARDCSGIKLSPEHRWAISEGNKGPKSAEHRQALSDAAKRRWEGQEITPEFREQMAAAARLGKGQPKSDEHRRKISEAQKGRQFTEEHLANIRAAKAAGGKPLKLTAEQIPEIRRRIAAGESLPSIAAAFGVKPASISDIKHGRSWRHIT